MLGRIHKHADSRLKFNGEKDKAKQLAVYKRFLKLENEMILRRHRSGESGLRIARLRSDLIDVLLQRLFDSAIQTCEEQLGKIPSPVCLIAQGGYGRAELSPLSDIDVMFLFPDDATGLEVKEFQTCLSDGILYILWDLGLKIGHATRTIGEVFEDAREDMHVKTALLESRLVAGSATLFEIFQRAYLNFCRKNPRDYLKSRLDDQEKRRERYGETVFLQEPDIKNGVGGLRDYQNTLWMARIKLGISRIEELASHNYLSKNEQRDFVNAYDFLLRVRNELHFSLDRRTDLLDLEKQPLVAHRLGYTNKNIFQRVESFMRDYYRHAQAIFRISRHLEKRLALRPITGESARISFREVIAARKVDRQRRIDGFIQRGNELSFESLKVFEEDPERLIRVFRHCQQWKCSMDFELESLVMESLPLINNRIINSERANASFRSILQETGRVYPILNQMHELGVLGRFLPEFDRLTCLVQHEFYHRYTADIHTLNTLKELDKIFAARTPELEKYRTALRETGAPALLYLILLLHDIGKAQGIAGHDEAGVQIARQVLERMHVNRKFWDLILFIIGHHLIMARIWQKHDIDDPQAIRSFADQVEDPEKLAFLYVHTYCDARGTATSLWNSYKDTLHTHLYLQTFEQLTAGDRLSLKNKEKKEMTLSEIRERKIPNVTNEEIEAHFELLPERYFQHTDADEIVLHIRMVNQLFSRITQAESVGALVPTVEWRDDLDRNLTVVNIVTWDRAGLFSKLAGAFSVAGLNILSAKAISRSDHIAIDTFYVAEPSRGVVLSQEARQVFETAVRDALVHNKDLLPEILVRARQEKEREWQGDDDLLSAPIPTSVNVYYDETIKRSLVEIQTSDRIGLLYQLTRTIYENEGDIAFARIATERGVAIDTFYIENANPEARGQPPEPEHLDRLRRSLLAVVGPDREAESEPAS